MTNRLTILGSGSANLVPGQGATSALIEIDGARLVFDMGRGTASRLAETGRKQDDIEHLFLSHFHPDHVSDLYPYLHAASWSQIDRRTKDLNIYGQEGTRAFIDKLFSVFNWKKELMRGYQVKVHDVKSGPLEIGRLELAVFDLGHSFGLHHPHFTLCADSGLTGNLVETLKGVPLGVFDAGHLSDAEIIELAIETGTVHLIASHQYRPLDEGNLNHAARAKGYTGRITVASDLLAIPLP